jgi:4'-phosphopantetheinyl transferase
MGVLLKRTLSETAVVGLWEITESVDVLLSGLKLNDEEHKLYIGFKNNQRKLHWLSHRKLLKELITTEDYSHVIYDEYGKPYLEDNLHFLSVAHSGKFSAAIISKRNHVGIDIERIHPKIKKIVSKFLSETEISQVANENRIEQLLVYWGAKEALYKLYGRKQLAFEENILINAFKYAEKGEFAARINTEDINKNFRLHYEKIEDYMLVYVEDEEST